MKIYRYNIGRTKGIIGLNTLKKELLLNSRICYLCNKEFNSYHLDLEHKIPIMLGGKIFDKNNCALCCQNCHKEKTIVDKFIIKSLKDLRLISGKYQIDSALSLEELKDFYLKYFPIIKQKIKEDSDWDFKHETISIEENRK